MQDIDGRWWTGSSPMAAMCGNGQKDPQETKETCSFDFCNSCPISSATHGQLACSMCGVIYALKKDDGIACLGKSVYPVTDCAACGSTPVWTTLSTGTVCPDGSSATTVTDCNKCGGHTVFLKNEGTNCTGQTLSTMTDCGVCGSTPTMIQNVGTVCTGKVISTITDCGVCGSTIKKGKVVCNTCQACAGTPICNSCQVCSPFVCNTCNICHTSDTCLSCNACQGTSSCKSCTVADCDLCGAR